MPPVLSDRVAAAASGAAAAAPDALPASMAALGAPPYRYVLFHWGWITITRRSLNLAVALAGLTFAALQGASLCLVTTPPEAIAGAVGRALRPLGLLGLPVKELVLLMLLALRFMATVRGWVAGCRRTGVWGSRVFDEPSTDVGGSSSRLRPQGARGAACLRLPDCHLSALAHRPATCPPFAHPPHPLHKQVFEECRNLCLGLASRGIDWRQQGLRGTLAICVGLFTRLFANLMARCDAIAVAMTARGFQGPQAHELRDGAPPERRRLLPSAADALLLACLGGLVAASFVVV